MQTLPDAALAATPGLWRLINLMVWLDLFVEQPGGQSSRETMVGALPAAPMLATA